MQPPYLSQHLGHLQQLWRSERRLPARIDLTGTAAAAYEATGQYAMLYPALRISDPEMAAEVLQQKLLPAYQTGIWDNDRAYYRQNLAWLGLYPAAENRLKLRIPAYLNSTAAGQRTRATRRIDKQVGLVGVGAARRRFDAQVVSAGLDACKNRLPLLSGGDRQDLSAVANVGDGACSIQQCGVDPGLGAIGEHQTHPAILREVNPHKIERIALPDRISDAGLSGRK